ncbi:FMP21 [Apiospora aurea]|uniref:Succinate dehydrogenase assembly factor 4, mitochondrial n=1 Tax=Apiospora aurea TaxID=335848 RepID=A0ABR1PU90_9PEZI
MAYRFLRTARPLSNLRPSSSTFTSTTRRAASSFASSPAPPRLPAEEQAEFERLQRTANTQQGFNPSSTPTPEPTITVKTAAATPTIEEEGTVQPNVPLRKGAPPEFEGETNPKTGEVGGPKNEPLRWGAAGDYSFNGRVTDF